VTAAAVERLCTRRACAVVTSCDRTRQIVAIVARRRSAERPPRARALRHDDSAGHQVRERHVGSVGPAAVAQRVQVHTHFGRRGRMEGHQ